MSRFKSSRLQPALPLTGRHWRSALYLVLLGSVLLLIIPWSMLINPLTGLLTGFLLLAGIVIWMQLRLHYLQSRMRRLEHHMHRLSQQRASSTLGQQTVSHLEAERYFSHDQTRH